MPWGGYKVGIVIRFRVWVIFPGSQVINNCGLPAFPGSQVIKSCGLPLFPGSQAIKSCALLVFPGSHVSNPSRYP